MKSNDTEMLLDAQAGWGSQRLCWQHSAVRTTGQAESVNHWCPRWQAVARYQQTPTGHVLNATALDQLFTYMWHVGSEQASTEPYLVQLNYYYNLHSKTRTVQHTPRKRIKRIREATALFQAFLTAAVIYLSFLLIWQHLPSTTRHENITTNNSKLITDTNC